MNLSILSGKGGTGKTTVAVNLALLTGQNYIDCDVEEPNGFIFLKPENVRGEKVQVRYPVVDPQRCTLCRKCAEVCQFNALAATKKNIMVFDKLCHACGACMIVCEPDAIRYDLRSIGEIETGTRGAITVKRGILSIGEHMGVPVIRQLLSELPAGGNILDSPPGTSCSVVNTIAFADYALLVTEPSVFGLHDLKLAVSLLEMKGIPFGVVINKYTGENTLIEDYLIENDIRLIGRIPYSREAAVAYSSGGMLIDLPEYLQVFEGIAAQLKEMA